MSKETSDEYIKTKPKALKAIDNKQNWRFLIAGKLHQVRTEEIDGYLEEDELEYNKKLTLIYLNLNLLKCDMCEDIGERLDIL